MLGAGLGPIALGRRGHAVKPIGDLVRIRDRAIAGQRPGRRRPDDHREAFPARGERHPYGIARVVLVFHLGFGERRLLDHRPHDGLRAAIKQSVFGKLQNLGGDARLGLEGHGRIGIVPFARDAEPLELLALHREPALRIGAAFAAKGDHGGGIGEVGFLLPLGAVILLLDLPLDRQAVAVPARHIAAVLAQHPLAARHEVLEDLIERMADVDVAIGVGRPIVQHEFGTAGAGLPQLLGEARLLPALQQFGLGLRQARAHRKIRLRQIERRGIVDGFAGVFVHGILRPSSLRTGCGNALVTGRLKGWRRAPRRRKSRTPRELLASSAGRAGNSSLCGQRHAGALAGGRPKEKGKALLGVPGARGPRESKGPDPSTTSASPRRGVGLIKNAFSF